MHNPNHYHRDAVLETTGTETDTVQLSFASELKILRSDKRGKFWEVLSHAPGDANLGLLNRNGMVLVNHDEKNEIGDVVKDSARVHADRKTRADIKLFDTAWANRAKSKPSEIPVSVGYHILSVVRTLPPDDDGIPTKIFSWRPYEVSLLTCQAADDGVGIGRSKIQLNQKKEMKNQSEITLRHDMLLHDNPHCESELIELKTRALLGEMEVKAYSQEAMQICMAGADRRKSTFIPVDNMEIGMSQRNLKEYSLARAIRSACENGGTPKNCFEADCDQQARRNSTLTAEGFLVPAEVNLGMPRKQYRDMQADIFGAGGAFVPTYVVPPTIEVLRNRMVVLRNGARVMAGLTGNVVIPREEAPATAYCVSEIGLLTDSQQVLGQIALTPHRVGATETYSKQLVFQSAPDAEGFFRDDLFKVLAIKNDALMLFGQGAASEPLGIMNTPGIGIVTFGATATWQKLVSFETGIGQFNADVPRMAYITTPVVKGAWKGIAVALTGATTVSSRQLWEDGNWGDDYNDGKVNGYRACSTNQIPNNQVLFGDFSSWIFGQFGGLDIVVDPYTKAKNAEIVITINNWIDGVARHPQSFELSSDAGNQ